MFFYGGGVGEVTTTLISTLSSLLAVIWEKEVGSQNHETRACKPLTNTDSFLALVVHWLISYIDWSCLLCRLLLCDWSLWVTITVCIVLVSHVYVEDGKRLAYWNVCVLWVICLYSGCHHSFCEDTVCWQCVCHRPFLVAGNYCTKKAHL